MAHDIVFVANGESNAEPNWSTLSKLYPKAKRIDNVPGILNAYQTAARLCKSEFVILVDADNVVVADDIDRYHLPKFNHNSSHDFVYVARAVNRVNGLWSGHGGIKIFPKDKILAKDAASCPDVTTSLGLKPYPIPQTWSVHEFDTDPYNTWRTTFREVVKLQFIDNVESRLWVTQFLTVGQGEFGNFSIAGAVSATHYIQEPEYDPFAINNDQFLRDRFAQENPERK